MKKKKILIVVYGAGHVNLAIPLIKELKNSHELYVMALTTAAIKCEREGVDYFGYKEHKDLWYKNAGELGRWALELAGEGIIDHAESVAYLGNNISELEVKYGKAKALKIFQTYGRAAFYPLNYFKRLLQKLSPDLVIATNSPRSERAAIEAASELGVRSICIGDLFLVTEAKWMARNGFADVVCVLNNEVKEFLVSMGRKKNDIRVTGNPAFDYLCKYKKINNRDDIRFKRGWQNKKIILWAVQYEKIKKIDNGSESIIELVDEVNSHLKNFLISNPDYHLVIRFHPSDLPQRIENYEIDDNSKDVADTLIAVDLVLVSNSTVGLQAAILGVPVISFDFSKYSITDPYSKMGISVGCARSEDLNQIILNAMNINKNLFNDKLNIGNATKNCIGVINEILGKS